MTDVSDNQTSSVTQHAHELLSSDRGGMPTLLIAWLVGAGVAVCAVAARGESVVAAPTKLIIDTDAGFDVDDVGMLEFRTDSNAHWLTSVCTHASSFGVALPVVVRIRTICC